MAGRCPPPTDPALCPSCHARARGINYIYYAGPPHKYFELWGDGWLDEAMESFSAQGLHVVASAGAQGDERGARGLFTAQPPAIGGNALAVASLDSPVVGAHDRRACTHA